MIYLFTDFGSHDLYLGQVKAVLRQQAPAVDVIDLCNDLVDYDVQNSAHLLSALARTVHERDAVLLCVVDPGVGGMRRPVVLQADGRWLVGPDNGLMALVKQRAAECRCWEIVWRPNTMSRSFHGRDLFAPIAAMLATGKLASAALREINDLQTHGNADDLPQIIYIDHYGNAMTGMRAGSIALDCRLNVSGQWLAHAGTFSEANPGAAFWYENSLGLIEIAVNQGRAATLLELRPGSPVMVVD
jgi:hypothetical protein